MESLSLSPIGYLRSTDQLKFAVPHQPLGGADKKHIIELNSGNNFEAALRDLSGFERVWLIWWFHRNSTWRPCVMPPRGEAKRRGVFATRSPHRPNPLGISCVQLIEIQGRTLTVGDTDLVDGTPILDIKPYIPEIDAFPESAYGWLEQVNLQYQGNESYRIEVSALAQAQLDWLISTWDIDFFTQAKRLLSIDPSPHRTRRIIKLTADNHYRMGCGAWRIFFSISKKLICISEIKAGYPKRALHDPLLNNIADKQAQIEFSTIWD